MSTTRHRSSILRGLFSLVVLGVLAFTLHSVVFSGASFTATTANTGNLFTAGNLGHSNDQNDRQLINAGGLYPGASRSGIMTLKGTGDVSGRYTLTVTSATPPSSSLAAALTLTITESGVAQPLYQGSLAGLPQLDLGSLAPDQIRSLTFTLAYPAANASPSLAGAATAVELTITGVSQ